MSSPGQVNPMAMPVADAARVLSAAGGRSVTPDMIETDIASGAPRNPDGTINVVHYAAWLMKETSTRED